MKQRSAGAHVHVIKLLCILITWPKDISWNYEPPWFPQFDPYPIKSDWGFREETDCLLTRAAEEDAEERHLLRVNAYILLRWGGSPWRPDVGFFTGGSKETVYVLCLFLGVPGCVDYWVDKQAFLHNSFSQRSLAKKPLKLLVWPSDLSLKIVEVKRNAKLTHGAAQQFKNDDVHSVMWIKCFTDPFGKASKHCIRTK